MSKSSSDKKYFNIRGIYIKLLIKYSEIWSDFKN